MPAPVDVAVAVLIRADGKTLLAQRPRDKVYAGYWEFPGGKVEAGEPVVDALRREIREELGVEIGEAYPWITRVFTYPHAKVRLHFYRVYEWRGEPRALEHEAVRWQLPGAIDLQPLLPANGPVLRGLMLPAEYAISRAGELGVEPFLERLGARLRGGLKLIQIRERGLPRDALGDFAQRVIALARPCGAKVLVNADIALAHMIGADGVHLTSEQLRAAADRPDLALCGVSCHTAAELRLAEKIGADFAVLGPVLATPSHPQSVPLGWQSFRALAAGAALPVFAIGGMTLGDLAEAMRCGAHGVAMVRGGWQQP